VNVTWIISNLLGIEYEKFNITVKDTTNKEFSSGPIMTRNTYQCIGNLQPNTFYTVKVFLLYECRTVSMSVTFQTDPESTDDRLPVNGCLEYRPVTSECLNTKL